MNNTVIIAHIHTFWLILIDDSWKNPMFLDLKLLNENENLWILKLSREEREKQTSSLDLYTVY